MTGKQLKNSILQWAIQGKLVPQDPNDEPASVLLEKIRAEKARLVKEGKLKKKDLEVKPIAEDEIPFGIPKGWEWVRISDLGDIITGGTPSKEHQEYYGDEYPFYKPGDLDKGVDIYESVDGLSQKGFNASRKLKANSILVTCIGATIGKTGLIIKEGSCNQQINAIIPYGGLCPKYIYYTICSPMLQMVIRKDAGQTTLPIMNKNAFCKLILPLPPLAEQHRIVAKIEELMPLVEKYGAAQEALDEWNQALPEKLKKSILQEAIQGKLEPQDPADEPASVLLEKIRAEKARLVKEGKLKKKDLEVKPIEEDEIPFEIPESWEWMRLGEIAFNQTGLSYNKGDLEKKVENPIRVLRGGNIQSGLWTIKADDVMISPEFVKKPNLTLQKNTFITPAVTSLEHLGKTALIEENHFDIVAGGFVLYLLPYYREDTLVKYLSFYFQTSFYNKYCKSIANKSGQAFWNLSRQKLMDLTIPIPPLAEQRRIVAKIEELFGLLNK